MSDTMLDCVLNHGENTKHFVVITQNIRSLRSNFDKFIVHLNICKELPDIIVFTEIWVNNYETNLCQINKYN